MIYLTHLRNVRGSLSELKRYSIPRGILCLVALIYMYTVFLSCPCPYWKLIDLVMNSCLQYRGESQLDRTIPCGRVLIMLSFINAHPHTHTHTHRRPKDLLCLGIFLAFIILMLSIAIYGTCIIYIQALNKSWPRQLHCCAFMLCVLYCIHILLCVVWPTCSLVPWLTDFFRLREEKRR